MVVENTGRGERAFDIYSRLLKDRIVFIGTPIDDQVANLVVAQTALPAVRGPRKEIALYINSPGGQVTAGLAIYDTMQYIRPPVSTICIGMAYSMAAVLLAGGAHGMRYALPHANILIHSRGAACRVRPPISRSTPRRSAHPGAAEPDPGSAHRPEDREGHDGHGARLLPDLRGSQRVRADRRHHPHSNQAQRQEKEKDKEKEKERWWQLLSMIFRRRGKSGEVKRHKPKCSFCGKMQGEHGVRLVAGTGVFICSECISVANEMLWGHNPPAAPASS